MLESCFLLSNTTFVIDSLPLVERLLTAGDKRMIFGLTFFVTHFQLCNIVTECKRICFATQWSHLAMSHSQAISQITRCPLSANVRFVRSRCSCILPNNHHYDLATDGEHMSANLRVSLS